jgi:regulator of protease activity HflC (stomatin/prohibitin superfamily)
MVTTILVILALIIGAVLAAPHFVKYSNMSSRDKDTEPGISALRSGIRGAVIGGVLLVLAFIQPYSIERIDAGHRGIVVNLSGSERGVASYQYKTGWVLYNTWFTQVLEFPTFQQHIEYDDQSVILKGGFIATIKPTFNYSLKEDAIGDMFVNLRRPITEIEQNWLKNAIVGSVNDEANKWEVDSIFNHRQAFEAAIVAECNVRLSKWFNVSQLRTNITPPEALQEAIISKAKAIQQAEASKQQAIAAKADGERKVAVARADSAEQVINAAAKAKSNKLLEQSLTPLLIQNKWIEAWKAGGSQVPTYISGGAGEKFMLNIK